MASDFRKFVGYSIEELSEMFPYYLEDCRFTPISFRLNDVETVYVSRSPQCKYIGIQYWDGEIVISNGKQIQPVTLDDLYFILQ